MSAPILIYTVGSKDHGLGHVKRCLTLARELVQRGVAVAFATEHETPGVGIIRGAGFSLYEYHPQDVSFVQLSSVFRHLIIDVKDDPSERMLDAARPCFEKIIVLSAAGYAPALAQPGAMGEQEIDHA